MREDRPFVKALGLPDREQALPGHFVLVGAMLQPGTTDALDFRGVVRRRDAPRSGWFTSRKLVRSPPMPRHTSNECGIRHGWAGAPQFGSWRRWLLAGFLISLAVFCRSSLVADVASASLAGNQVTVATSPSDAPSHRDDCATKSDLVSPSDVRSRIAWTSQPLGDAPLLTSWSRCVLDDGAPDGVFSPGVCRALLQVFRI